MAYKKITDLEEATTLKNNDLIEVVTNVEGIPTSNKSKMETVKKFITDYHFPDSSETDQGVNGNGFSIKDCIDSIGSKKGTIYLKHDSDADTTIYTVSTDLAIPENICFIVENGAIVTVEDGNTLTINGAFEVGLYQVFSGSGDIIGLKKLYPEWFGAVADGSTDDSAAINKTFISAESGSTVYFSERLGYGVASAVICESNVNIEMLSPIIYTGTNPITVLTIGTIETYISNCILKLQVSRTTYSDWESENDIGIKLINIYTSNIWINKAVKFTINVQFFSENHGFVYNTIFLKNITSGKYGLDLCASTSGWVNENIFIGGKFAGYSGVNPTKDRYGIRIRSLTGYINNSNLFIKPSFELGASNTSGEAVPVVIENGSNNRFIDVRNEDNDNPTLRVLNDSTENYLSTLFNLSSLSDESSYPYNLVESGRFILHNAIKTPIFHSGDLVSLIGPYSNTYNFYHIPGVHIGNSDSINRSVAGNIIPGTDYITIKSTKCIGGYINTEKAKQFIIKRSAIAGYGGRILVNCFDEDGNLLTNTDPNHPYVKSHVTFSLNWVTYFGGSYMTGSDSNKDIFFKVHDDVKSIAVEMCGWTNVLKLKSFSILSDIETNVYTKYETPIAGANIAIETPDKGIENEFSGWKVGKTLYNANPAIGSPQGWVCIRNENSTANGGEPTGETAWAVIDMKAAADGDVIGAKLDDDSIHWTTINGTPTGNVITVTTGVPTDRSIVNGAKILWFRFTPMPNL